MQSTRTKLRVYRFLKEGHGSVDGGVKYKMPARTLGYGYLRESDWDKNHKENCNYKEEGHVARLVISVAGHDATGLRRL